MQANKISKNNMAVDKTNGLVFAVLGIRIRTYCPKYINNPLTLNPLHLFNNLLTGAEQFFYICGG